MSYWITCPICRETYDRSQGTGKHTECEEIQFRRPLTDEQRMRSRWDKKRKQVSGQIMRHDNNCCVRCGSRDRLTIDHIIPISRGGTNDPSNLQTLCVRCNSSKRDR